MTWDLMAANLHARDRRRQAAPRGCWAAVRRRLGMRERVPERPVPLPPSNRPPWSSAPVRRLRLCCTILPGDPVVLTLAPTAAREGESWTADRQWVARQRGEHWCVFAAHNPTAPYRCWRARPGDDGAMTLRRYLIEREDARRQAGME